jgi:predicted phosphatase
VEWIATQAYCLKLLQQASIIHNIFHVLLLEPYVSDRRTVPKLLPHIEVDGKEEYKLNEILQSEYRYSSLRYCMKYKGYSADHCQWLLAENLTHAHDMVR